MRQWEYGRDRTARQYEPGTKVLVRGRPAMVEGITDDFGQEQIADVIYEDGTRTRVPASWLSLNT